ncbi:MAG: MFS transporter [Candidatus Heimdallarchaeaceae archaeon]
MLDLRRKKNLSKTRKSNLSIVILGIIGMFTISSVSILHTNEKEFIQWIQLSVSNFQISLYDTVLYISYLVIGILVGIISDKIGKRKSFIIVGSIGAATFSGLLTIAPNYSILLLFRFLQGTFTVLAWQTFMTMTLDLSTPENRGKNMGIFGTFLAISMGLSPMIGGFLADGGINIPYYVAVAFNLTALFLSVLILQEPSNIKKKTSVFQNLKAVKDTPELIIPAAFNFIDRFHMGFIIFALPLLILDVLGLEPSMRGIAMGIFALPFIILQYPFGRLSDKVGRYKLLIYGSIGYGIILSFIGLVGTRNYVLLLVVLFILGTLSGITASPNMALVGDYVGEENRATGMGFFNFAGNLGIVLGPVIGGALLLSLDYVYTFLIMGIVEFIGISILVIWMIFKKQKLIEVNRASIRKLSPDETVQKVVYIDSSRQHEK